MRWITSDVLLTYPLSCCSKATTSAGCCGKEGAQQASWSQPLVWTAVTQYPGSGRHFWSTKALSHTHTHTHTHTQKQSQSSSFFKWSLCRGFCFVLFLCRTCIVLFMWKIPTFVLHWDGQTLSTGMTKVFLFREDVLIYALLFNILKAIYKGETSKIGAGYYLE